MENNPYEAPAAEGLGVGGGALSTGTYEFGEAENLKIKRLAARSRMWGIVALVTGVLGVIALILAFVFRAAFVQGGLESNYVTIFIVMMMPIAAVNLVIGPLYLGSAKRLQWVVDTQGDDVEHMMHALSKLASAFMVEFLIGLLVVLGAFTAGVLLAIYEPELAEDISSGDFDD
jgi:hypothetical protein